MRRVLSLGAVVVSLASAGSLLADDGALYRRLPKDPLLVLAVSTDELSAKLDAAAEWLAAGAEAANVPGVGGLDAAPALPHARDLLAAVGPEAVLALDLPPLDSVAATLRVAGYEGYSKVLGHSGLLARVRDEAKLEAALRAALGALPGSTRGDDGISGLRIPIGGEAAATSAAVPVIDLYWMVQDGRFAAGFSREWVASAVGERPVEERLPAGDDFKTVFAQLDERPASLTYVNLPKLRELLGGSLIVRSMLENDPEMGRFVAPLLDAKVMGVGLGSTSVSMGPGVRTTHFGPYWMSGTVASSGLLAALAVPNLLVASDRGKARRTLDDIQSIAVACEGFSSDALSYPGPTRGWVPIGEVAAFLEPVYIAALPRTDAWDNPILYWSDGSTYRILSTGVDGRMDQDWTGVTEPTLSPKQVGDIVVADGRILVLPRQLSE